MRPFRKILAIAVTMGIGLSLSAQEYDDMYFTKADRKSKFTNEVFNEKSSFVSEEAEPVKISKSEDLATDSYSAKTINPDYISKYKSEALDEEADPEDNENYYVEQQDKKKAYASNNSTVPSNTYRRNNVNWRFSVGYGYGSFYNPWYWDPFYSYNYPYYSSYSYYSPYGRRIYRPYYDRYGNYGGYRTYNYWSAGGYNYYGGGYGSALYCPPGYYGGGNTYVYNGTNVFTGGNSVYDPAPNNVSTQTINTGPRSARNSTAVQAASGRQYRNTDAGSSGSSVPGYVPINTSENTAARTVVSNPQGNYYKRSRTTTEGVRTSQQSRVAVTTGQSLNEASRTKNSYNYSSGRTTSRSTYTASRTNSYDRSTLSQRTGSSVNRSGSSVNNRPRSAGTRTSYNRSSTNQSSYNRSGTSGSRSYNRSTSPSTIRTNTGSRGYSGGSSMSSGGGSRMSSGSSGGGRSSGGGASRSSGGGGRRGN